MPGLNPYHASLLLYGGSALLVVLGLILVARWRFGLWVQLVAVALGILLLWAGLFFGAELGYRSWQSMPDPPDEAFADTAPIGFFLAGWLPAGVLTIGWWGLLMLIGNTRRQLRTPAPPPPPAPGDPKTPPTTPPDPG